LFNQKYLTVEHTAVTATDVVGEEKKFKKVKREILFEIEIKCQGSGRNWRN